MTASRTMTVTTTFTPQTAIRKSNDRAPAQNSSTRARGWTEKQARTPYNVQKQSYPSTQKSGSVGQVFINPPDEQARRKSSSGSSSDPSGSSGSGGESNHHYRFFQSAGLDRAHSTIKKRSISSDLSYGSLGQIMKSLPGSFPKSPRRRQKLRITIAKPFTDFGAPNRRRSTYGTEDTMKVVIPQPQAPLSMSISNRLQSGSPTGLRRDSNCPTIVRLSPRSLRKARLRILDKNRRSSSSSFVLELENDRRGSTLLPRQHYCEPGIQGHHSTPKRQVSITGTHKEQNGSPDPNSPDRGNSSASPGLERGRKSQGPRFRIANMRVTEILRLGTKESCYIEIVPTSKLHKLPLDDMTKASIQKIMRRKHGSTKIGVGPWVEVVSCGDDFVWNNWCCLSRSPLANEDIILVPLTDAQTTLLGQALEGSGSSP